ncbi:ataxin-2-like protein isoform X2 [Engraulis encrasicolus]|uniref:ataxin-2-like protein isoform X2 n=1 Tax=Engraulis encrasicolus TaxID=184585 RepID=UPI002FD5FDFC
MLKPQQPNSSGRKTSNGTPGSSTMSSTTSGINTSNRTTVGRSRSVKPPFQSPPVFEGVYNNARMLHFLTAVVGSTCDVRVKNGTVYEGIFKTLSSRCELAVDAVHRRGDDEGSVPPRREEITDTMIFSPNDLVTMTCRDVDLNYATRDTFTDTAISSGRVNGEHKEKVLQRWEGGDSNGESYDLEGDASNGWDANEMFRYNEENYGVKSTYDSSLSMYTVALDRSSNENFRARELRAARLASEIESSPQYRHRVALENDDGRTDEDKFSAVERDRERGRESPRDRDRERGRDSPSGPSSREGKYIPLPQRAREMGGAGGSLRGDRDRGGDRSDRGRGGSYHSSRSTPPSSSPRPPLPPASSGSGPQSNAPSSNGAGGPPSERGSPLSSRASYTPSSPPSSSSSSSSSHALPHSHSLPHALADAGRPVNGVPSRTSPKSQRPHQPNRAARPSNTHPHSSASRSPKSEPGPQESSLPSTPYMDNKQKPSGPAPLFPVDVNEILSAAGKDRAAAAAEAVASPDDGKSSKTHSAQQLSQIEELRKFGKEFRLGSSTGGPSSPGSAAAAPAGPGGENPAAAQPGAPKAPSAAAEAPCPVPDAAKPGLTLSQQPPAPASPADDPHKEKDAASTPAPPSGASSLPLSDRQSPATPQLARTPGAEDGRPEAPVEAVTDSGSVCSSSNSSGSSSQVKRSTLNPNAKEFNPISKPPMAMSKPTSAPTPPRPTPPSPSVVLQHPAGQGAVYGAPYLSYVSQIHPVQPQQMYQYPMQAVNQGKYPRAKGSVVAQRSDHGSSAPPMLQAASAAGAPLVASHYPQSYLPYNPPQYGGQQVIQAMSPYPGQPAMYSMLQGGARMLSSGGGHPQALGPPGGPQFPGQNEGPQGPQQGIYAPQSFSHHSGAVHQPQPSSTPTGSQPQPQHTTPSPGQTGQSGPQGQSLYHSGPLSAPTPPNLPPGHSSPQASYPLPGYNIHGPQGLPHTYNLAQITQAHVQGPMSGPHPSGTHGPPQMVMLHAPPQAGPGSSQHPQHGPQQGPPQHFAYIGHPQAVQVPQQHPQQLSFHPQGN